MVMNMSGVLVKNRGVSEMEFLNTAHQMELFTIQRTAHDIPKTYTFTLRIPLCESARKINKYLVYANSIYPKNNEDFRKRKEFQKAAIIEIQNMFELLRLTSEILPIKNNALNEWTEMLLKIENLTKRWSESDSKRFSGHILYYECQCLVGVFAECQQQYELLQCHQLWCSQQQQRI